MCRRSLKKEHVSIQFNRTICMYIIALVHEIPLLLSAIIQKYTKRARKQSKKAAFEIQFTATSRCKLKWHQARFFLVPNSVWCLANTLESYWNSLLFCKNGCCYHNFTPILWIQVNLPHKFHLRNHDDLSFLWKQARTKPQPLPPPYQMANSINCHHFNTIMDHK